MNNDARSRDFHLYAGTGGKANAWANTSFDGVGNGPGRASAPAIEAAAGFAGADMKLIVIMGHATTTEPRTAIGKSKHTVIASWRRNARVRAGVLRAL